MSAIPSWRVGSVLEVIVGDLGEPRFQRELREHGPMDQASSTFCRAFAAQLRERTGRALDCPIPAPHPQASDTLTIRNRAQQIYLSEPDPRADSD